MNIHQNNLFFRVFAPTVLAAFLAGSSLALAAPLLPTELASYGVLGAQTVTNTGPTTVYGNVGVSPGSAVTGSTSITLPEAGTAIIAGPTSAAGLAQTQLGAAISNLGFMGSGTILGADLSAYGVLTPGVYTVLAGVSNLTGSVTLDGQGNANAVWVFQMASTLITSSNSVVNMINTGSGAGVYWNVGSSATLGTYSTFQGNILANTSITLATGATIGCGSALAHVGSVTMDTNTIGAGCTGLLAGSDGLNGGLDVPAAGGAPVPLPFTPIAAVPEPQTYAMLLAGLGLLGFTLRSKKQDA